jgi:hypothetical protein
MSNEQAVHFIEHFNEKCAGAYRPSTGPVEPSSTLIAHLLCEEARYRWFEVVEEEDVMVDDISCVVLQFHSTNVPAQPMTAQRISRMTNISVMLEDSREEESSISRPISGAAKSSIAVEDEEAQVRRKVVRRDLVRGSIVEESRD